MGKTVLMLFAALFVLAGWFPTDAVAGAPPLQFAVGGGGVAPVDFGTLRALKGEDAKAYVFGAISTTGLPGPQGLVLTLRADQVLQRQFDGIRPPIQLRLEAHYGF